MLALINILYSLTHVANRVLLLVGKGLAQGCETFYYQPQRDYDARLMNCKGRCYFAIWTRVLDSSGPVRPCICGHSVQLPYPAARFSSASPDPISMARHKVSHSAISANLPIHVS
jgi:hypothetical protein